MEMDSTHSLLKTCYIIPSQSLNQKCNYPPSTVRYIYCAIFNAEDLNLLMMDTECVRNT
jgi:hypothetical protein